MTNEQVAALQIGQIIYHRTLRNADKSPFRARVNGKLRLWKRRPNYFELPLKRGLRQHFYLTPTNVEDWQLTE